jgi:three-Cys-motif partner protein
MTDPLPTTWEIEAHTEAKHAILGRYLDAWFPILSRQSHNVGKRSGKQPTKEILFIDGFAGPGEYVNKEPGSPVIALKSALNHRLSFPIPVRMLFIEQRADRFAHLNQVIAPLLEQARSSQNLHAVDPRQGDCDVVLNELLDEGEQSKIEFGPALAFLDQFGYGAVSMELITRILSYPQCEVFTYLNYLEMNRWITDPHKAEAFKRAFGGDEWREATVLPEQQRRQHLLESYKAALRTRARAKYVASFLMFDRANRPLYWLLFCTNNIRGLEEMKKAMWFVDKSGGFRFSDRDDASQLRLLEESFDSDWLANELQTRLAGRTMTAWAVKEYVLCETPCYLFKNALRSLEMNKTMTTLSFPVGRKPGTFPDEQLDKIRLSFASSLF